MPGDLIFDIMYNPYGVERTILWHPDLLISASSIGDYIDRSGRGYNPNAGAVEGTSSLGPPVHLFPGGI